MDATAILRAVYALTLLIGPGAAIAFAPGLPALTRPLRLALAVTLSPMVVAAEVVVAAAAGLSFASFIDTVAPLNLLGLLPIAGAWRRTNPGEPPWAALGIALLAVAPALVLLFGIPHMRDYGWHNMMQVSAIQQFGAMPQPPEEMDLAGFRMNYASLGFAQLAAISALLDRPAVLLFPGLNLLHFVCLFLFLAAATRRISPAPGWLVGLAIAIALLLPGLADLLAGLLRAGHPALGETRIEPMTGKYATLDSMVFGLSCLAAAVYALVRGLLAPERGIVALLLVATLGCGVAYPLLFPSCALLAGAMAAAMLAGRYWPGLLALPRYPAGSIAALILGFTAVTAVVGFYITRLGVSAGHSPVRLVARWELGLHLTQLAIGFAPMALLLVPSLVRAIRARAGWPLVLLGLAGAMTAGFVVFRMPTGVEYKFLFGALLVVVPILAAQCAAWARATPGRLALAGAFIAVQAAASWGLWQWQVPPAALLASAMPLDERTAQVHPADWVQGWMRAVRDFTPSITVLLTGDTDQPVAVFTNRPLYVAADWMAGRPDGGKSGRAGYTMNSETILVGVKGYPDEVVQARRAVLRRCFAADTGEDQLRASLAALALLDRPVALHFAGPAAMLDLLRRESLGRPVFTGGADTVWLIQPAGFRSAGL